MSKQLPCYPCPHKAVCCSWGTSLTEAEAEAIEAEYPWAVDRSNPEDTRTYAQNGRCVFLQTHKAGCAIHNKPYYPTVCKGFPFKQGATDAPYEGDATICPEVAR